MPVAVNDKVLDEVLKSSFDKHELMKLILQLVAHEQKVCELCETNCIPRLCNHRTTRVIIVLGWANIFNGRTTCRKPQPMESQNQFGMSIKI